MDDFTGIAQLLSGGGVIAFAAAVLMEAKATRKVLEMIQKQMNDDSKSYIERLTKLEERLPKMRWRTPPFGVPTTGDSEHDE